MKQEDLKDGGVYRLTRDVTNPRVDKRGANLRRGNPSIYNWHEKFPVWKKGMRFRYIATQFKGDDVGFQEPARIENFDGDLHGGIRPDCYIDGESQPNPKWVLLVDALEPAPEDFDTAYSRACPHMDTCHADILAALFDLGKVNEADLAAAYAEVNRKWDEEERERKAREEKR